MDLHDRLLQAIERHALLDPGHRVVVAVSGGQDSVALTWLLAQLREKWRLELVVAHLHHGLRGEAADADQAFVADFAERLGLPFVAEQVSVEALARRRRIGLEEAGREARYAFLERVAAGRHAARIALGHTADDQAETVLLNLLRGAGLAGLAGMAPRRGPFIRPLLTVTRSETRAFCHAQGLSFRTDETNADLRFRRNQVRAELLPWLEAQHGPGVRAALSRTAEHLRAELEWTAPLVAASLQDARTGEGLRCQALRRLPEGLRYRVLRAWLEERLPALTNVSTERWQALEALALRTETGKRVELSGGWNVRQEYGKLLLQCGTELRAVWPDQVALTVPGEAQLPDGRRIWAAVVASAPPPAPHQAVLDADRAGQPLALRLPRPGDRFVPSGMSGHKKLQDFFVDGKVPRAERTPPLLVGPEGDILWVVGQRLAETARPTADTRNFLVVGTNQPAGR